MSTDEADSAHDWTLLVQAASQAANRLQISEQELATIIGGSDRNKDDLSLKGYQSVSENAALFLRINHSLDTLTGGDAATTISWLRSYNTSLTGCPIDLLRSSAGLRDVLGCLESGLCR
jgi:hypothetical protein